MAATLQERPQVSPTNEHWYCRQCAHYWDDDVDPEYEYAIDQKTGRELTRDDVDTEARFLQIRHRPETGTPLKNGAAAERKIAVDQHYVRVIEDYIQHHRYEVEDEYGREPLITSRPGRLTEAPIRLALYRWTRPCVIASCPHDEYPETCDWMVNNTKASRCPSSCSPHSVRRGAITQHLRDGIPEEAVTDRMNVSSDVLDQHYDQRSEWERMETRREFL